MIDRGCGSIRRRTLAIQTTAIRRTSPQAREEASELSAQPLGGNDWELRGEGAFYCRAAILTPVAPRRAGAKRALFS